MRIGHRTAARPPMAMPIIAAMGRALLPALDERDVANYSRRQLVMVICWVQL